MLSSSPVKMKPHLKGYKYRPKGTIAKGQCAQIQQYDHEATKEVVAVKLISLEGYLDEGALEKIKKIVGREISLAKHLQHANVLNCYEGKMRKRKAYMVMELMEGGSLFEYLKEKGPLTQCEARKFFPQLIHAVSYCHRLLLVHRDIKPANILLDKKKKNLKLMDFGLSNFVNPELKLITPTGTKYYRAPETVNGVAPYHGYEVDIFSCGATLYHLLFKDPSLGYSARLEFELPEDDATKDVCDLIERMTKYYPEERITIPEIKKHKWFLGGDDQEFLQDPHLDKWIDNDIVCETVETIKCGRIQLIQYLIEGQYNEETTTYKILKTKKMRGG